MCLFFLKKSVWFQSLQLFEYKKISSSIDRWGGLLVSATVYWILSEFFFELMSFYEINSD